MHRARAGRRSDDAGVNVHVRGQGIAAAGSWHGVKGTWGFSRRAVHKKGEMTAAVGRYPSTGRRGQSGGMHRRPVGAVGPAVCTDGPAGAVGLTRVVCRGAPEGAVGWYAPTTVGGSRTDGPGGEVGRYAPTSHWASGGSRARYVPTGPVGQSGDMHRRPVGAVERHRRAGRGSRAVCIDGAGRAGKGSRSGLQILAVQVVTQRLPQGPSGFQACLGSKVVAVLQLLVQPQR